MCLLSGSAVASLAIFCASRTEAADLFTTNRDCLSHFWSVAEQHQRPVTIVSFGDSMADSYRSPSYFLMNRLVDRLGAAGYSLLNYRNQLRYSLTNGASVFYGPSPLWFTAHLDLPTGAGLWWFSDDAPGGVPSDQCGVFWVSHPGGGLFTFSVSTNSGPWTQKFVLNGYSAEPAGHFTNVMVAPDLHRVRVDGLTGTNCILGPQLLLAQTGGVHVVFMDHPGINLDHVTNVATAVRNPIFAALQPDLLLWHMKESGSLATSNCLVECETWWSNSAPACAVVYIGTTWILADDTDPATLSQNLLVRGTALNFRRAYVDLMQPSVSYEWLWSQGFMWDGVHLNAAGGQWAATVMWNDLGLFALGQPRSLNLSLLGNEVRLSFPTATGILYSVETAADPRDWSPCQANVGDGTVVATNLPAADAHRQFRLNLRPAN